MSKSKLYTPIKTENEEVKNKTLMTLMSFGYEQQDGRVSEGLKYFWVERAKGGVGLIVIDVVTVDSNVPYLGFTISLSDDKF